MPPPRRSEGWPALQPPGNRVPICGASGTPPPTTQLLSFDLQHLLAQFTLNAAIHHARDAVQPLAVQRQYHLALSQLASLREPVDGFFEAVLVNAEDANVRANRYALLAELRGLFLGVADISLLG